MSSSNSFNGCLLQDDENCDCFVGHLTEFFTSLSAWTFCHVRMRHDSDNFYEFNVIVNEVSIPKIVFSEEK